MYQSLETCYCLFCFIIYHTDIEVIHIYIRLYNKVKELLSFKAYLLKIQYELQDYIH